MKKKNLPEPTKSELAILNILWDRGPSTVRQVNETMSKNKATGYTTTLKLMQIMTDKGLLLRDDSSRTHIFNPAISQEQIQKHLVGDFLERVFSGSAEQLVMRALSDKKVSVEELDKIKKMVEEFERN
ncbi:MAG: BlaI/MecI/CopY family transcriptional regulator [Planctomycetota bacterium]|jgi:predicted transcriptional regulator